MSPFHGLFGTMSDASDADRCEEHQRRFSWVGIVGLHGDPQVGEPQDAACWVGLEWTHQGAGIHHVDSFFGFGFWVLKVTRVMQNLSHAWGPPQAEAPPHARSLDGVTDGRRCRVGQQSSGWRGGPFALRTMWRVFPLFLQTKIFGWLPAIWLFVDAFQRKSTPKKHQNQGFSWIRSRNVRGPFTTTLGSTGRCSCRRWMSGGSLGFLR